MHLSASQKFRLYIFSAVGFLGVNSLLLYSVIFHPEQIKNVQTNVFAITRTAEKLHLLEKSIVKIPIN